MRKRLFLILFVPVVASAQMDTSKLRPPHGFHISIFADTKQSPRMLTFSPGGVLMATATSEGTVLAMPDMFPKQYQGDLFVAYHGSWNRVFPPATKSFESR